MLKYISQSHGLLRHTEKKSYLWVAGVADHGEHVLEVFPRGLARNHLDTITDSVTVIYNSINSTKLI